MKPVSKNRTVHGEGASQIVHPQALVATQNEKQQCTKYMILSITTSITWVCESHISILRDDKTATMTQPASNFD